MAFTLPRVPDTPRLAETLSATAEETDGDGEESSDTAASPF
jgi:hypothetical protein